MQPIKSPTRRLDPAGPASIVAIFARGGADADPVSGTLSRPAIGASAETLRAACLSFEIPGAAGPGGGVDRARDEAGLEERTAPAAATRGAGFSRLGPGAF